MSEEQSLSVVICTHVDHLRDMLDIPAGRLTVRQYCKEWIQRAWDSADNFDSVFPVWVSSDARFNHWHGGPWSRSQAGHWVSNGVAVVYYRGCGEQTGRALLEHITKSAKLLTDLRTVCQNVVGYV